jgi:hypothetical protein
MKIYRSAAVAAALACLTITTTTLAATPTLSLSGSGDSVQLHATGDANASVIFYYNVGAPGGAAYFSIGTTATDGTFSRSINASSYGLNTAYPVYVIVGSSQSTSQSWPGSSSNQNTNTTTSGTLSFDRTSISIVSGQSTGVNISGGSGYYVSAVSNPSIVTTSLNNNQLTISGTQNGSTNVTVCSANSGCSSVSVTVGNSSNTSQGVIFSPAAVTLSAGQTVNVTIGGSGSGFFVTLNPPAAIARTTLSGNTITITGVGAGSSSLSACSATGGGCSDLAITVSGTTVATPAPVTTPVILPSAPTSNASLLAVIQSMQTQLAQMLTQIQTIAGALNQITAALGSTSSISAPTTTGGAYTFTLFLESGSTGPEVSALQKRLTELGFYSGPITGSFGSLTKAAVIKFQTAKGIDARGYIGPETRVALNVR